MDEILFSENIGKSIIQFQYVHYNINTLDDEELIPIIKAVINGISSHLLSIGNKKAEINKLTNNLKRYCKDLYLEVWLNNREEDEDMNIAKINGEKYFEHLYKYEKHPKDSYKYF
ncbi:MAG: hypothetical protein AB1394_11255 [Bacteroidota bacterium]